MNMHFCAIAYDFGGWYNDQDNMEEYLWVSRINC